MEKYRPLKHEIARMWAMGQGIVTRRVVVGTVGGAQPTRFEKYVKEIGTDMRAEQAGKNCSVRNS